MTAVPPASVPPGVPPSVAAMRAGQPPADSDIALGIQKLPAYSRSLLRIEVPVVVTLAETRQPISRLLDLGPGAILHFDKPYDEPLTVSVGRSTVAVGEAVKVGEKFGIRISSMVLPEEKFEPLKPKPATRS